MLIELKSLNKILTALDKQIRIHGGYHISLVVCGGSALAALGLVNRTTKDVDVLGKAEETDNGIKICKIKSFPKWLEEAAKTVARDYFLPENWLNLGPASQLETGLPKDFENRLVKKKYGEYLTVFFISRKDQVYFKLYAAIDRGDYHIQDLFSLKPTNKEIMEAVNWVLTQDVSEGFKLILKDFLKRHGYEDIAKRI